MAPAAGDLHVRLIHLPAISDPMAAGPGGLSEQRREPLHPPIDGDVVDLDAALGEQLLDVVVGEAKAQVPADRQHDHIRRKAETGEGRPCNGIGVDAASSHDTSLAGRVCSQQMQQRPVTRCCHTPSGLHQRPEPAAVYHHHPAHLPHEAGMAG
jgi:hypothetical protein